MKSIQIGLLGFGTVGSGAYRILTDNAAHIAGKAGARLEVKRILVRDASKKRRAGFDGAKLTTDPSVILDDPEIDIVVEVMGGIEPAESYLLKAMEAGKSVVTANKDLIADRGPKLRESAIRNSVDLLFEASVAGGLPIIRPLQHCLAANRIHEILGIINGTTNYILTAMSSGDSDFGAMLREAQEKGYAEADPTADVEGHDAARKIAILASIAFGAGVTSGDVFVEGISRICREDILYARDLGYAVKLLGIARDTAEGIEVRVHPCFIPRQHPLASVNDVYNAVFVKSDAAGETMFFGRGAGSLPTGSAVVADIIEAARHRKAGTAGLPGIGIERKPLKKMADIRSRYYLRFQAVDRPGVLAAIAGALGENAVSIASALQTKTDGRTAEIVMVTHDVREGDIQASVERIRGLSVTAGFSNLIRLME